ncbi:unnamed protein product [Spodoptera littoralis]|uniref:SHSP domain-containing protein n=1 Tax=Spodoptera littoralis TaxID=7109 RepID=A0A9P0I588_SPOLI|nr:unnamed protein product [Spodoptera littoralis]CAH1639992.1 unnamed protein product [Spodoptera littoralis]
MPLQLTDQHFALALTPEDILTMVAPQYANDYYRPWKELSSLMTNFGTTIKSDRAKFQVNLDVQHFAPEEISVKTADGFVVIEGQHGEKRDGHGWVSRQFKRRYPLPEGCCLDFVESRLSSDGVLTVTAPLERPISSNERIIPIIHTGPVKKLGSKGETGDGETSPRPHGENRE